MLGACPAPPAPSGKPTAPPAPPSDTDHRRVRAVLRYLEAARRP
ncbi:hypothetical protein ACO0M4_25665 [Streptomyces sp. RGM 3693]